MNKYRVILFLACVIAFLAAAHAQVPQIVSYQGRVISGGANFNGSGGFKFALVSADGNTTYWSNDGATPPVMEIPLTVTNGLYSVLLGDTTVTNMTSAIPVSAFSNADVRLRIWFNDEVHGSELLSPDQRIVAVGYAITAASAATAQTVSAGAIGTAQLAAGAVTNAQLASNAVGLGNIAAGAVGTTQLASGAVTAAQLGANAVQSGNIAVGAIGTTQLANGSVTSAQLGANAVQSGNIAAGAVGTAQLAPGAVTASILGMGAVMAPNYSPDCAVFFEETAYNVSSASSSTNWAPRTLTGGKVLGSSISMSGNTIILAPGTYYVAAEAQTYACNNAQLVLRDITDGATGNPTESTAVIRGLSSFNYNSSAVYGPSILKGIVAVTGSARSYQLWQYVSSRLSTADTFGEATNNAAQINNRYSEITIIRLQ